MSLEGQIRALGHTVSLGILYMTRQGIYPWPEGIAQGEAKKNCLGQRLCLTMYSELSHNTNIITLE